MSCCPGSKSRQAPGSIFLGSSRTTRQPVMDQAAAVYAKGQQEALQDAKPRQIPQVWDPPLAWFCAVSYTPRGWERLGKAVAKWLRRGENSLQRPRPGGLCHAVRGEQPQVQCGGRGQKAPSHTLATALPAYREPQPMGCLTQRCWCRGEAERGASWIILDLSENTLFLEKQNNELPIVSILVREAPVTGCTLASGYMTPLGTDLSVGVCVC